MRTTLIGLGLAALIGLAPAALAAREPTPEARDAGRVHELAVMLESVTLRCKLIGVDLDPAFTSFRARQARALARAQDSLKQHFGVVRAADMNGAIDQFFIQTYNFYGTGRTDRTTCDSFAQLMARLAEADADAPLLMRIAQIMVPEPMLNTQP